MPKIMYKDRIYKTNNERPQRPGLQDVEGDLIKMKVTNWKRKGEFRDAWRVVQQIKVHPRL